MHSNKGFAAQMAPFCDWMDLQVLCLKRMLHASSAGCLDHGRDQFLPSALGLE